MTFINIQISIQTFDNFFASCIIPNLIKLINIIALPLGIVLSPISIGLKNTSLFFFDFFEKYFYHLNKIFIASLHNFFAEILYLKFIVLSDKSFKAFIRKHNLQ